MLLLDLLLGLVALLVALVALLVALLDYLPGDALAAEAERYGHGKRHSTQQDQERGRYEFRGDAELGQGREGRQPDYAVLRDAAGDVAARPPPHDSRPEVSEEGGEHQDQD